MVSINTEEELSLYNLEGKWNDYIGVQKEVLKVLKNNSFFVKNIVLNQKTDLGIKINPKGIKETLGAGKRFQKLPKRFKMYKVATLSKLKQIIQTAEVLEDEVPNYHVNGMYTFAYLKNEIIIDGEVVVIRISIMKRVDSNWFWIHHIDEKKKVLNYSTRPKRQN